MNPDPTVTVSCDYLVEFTDDGQQPDPGESEVIVIPPPPGGPDTTSLSGNLPAQEPQP
jgi:hypothetical protein